MLASDRGQEERVRYSSGLARTEGERFAYEEVGLAILMVSLSRYSDVGRRKFCDSCGEQGRPNNSK